VDVLRLLGISAMVTLAGLGLAVFLLTRKKQIPGGGAAA
jgi:hypothetical protein